ncbi:CsbD family protein [Salinisphaera aquimarina]|uniref:CsbD family protein n=1 Tax=Salinisphaera aquimarina TaxID=2094031 RepID=A0ABV7EK61_9GAMM
MVDKERIKGKAEEVKGSIKEQVGKVTGNHETEAEGRVEKNKGKTRDKVGKVKDTARDVAK